jgi:hypothetical protein
MACERQIVGIVGALMLFGDDVFDVMPQLAVLLAQPAVFAPVVSPAAHEVPSGRLHVLLNC